MNRKGSTALIVGIIVAIIVVVGLIFLLIIVSQDQTKKPTQNNVSTMNLYLGSIDATTKKDIDSNYVLLTEAGQFLSEGKLSKDSLIEVKDIPKNQKVIVFCHTNGYYSSKNLKEFATVELENNASKFVCSQDPIGNLKVIHVGDLNSKDNIIKFNISTDKYFKGLSAVISWAGVISVEFKDDIATCESNWLNYSYYNAEGKVYTWLPENHYLCNKIVQVCSSINGQTCVLKAEVPPRYTHAVDQAISTGRDLDKETVYELVLYVKMEDIKTTGDYLEIRFYDSDLAYQNNQFIKTSENGGNVGNKEDFVYHIRYEQ